MKDLVGRPTSQVKCIQKIEFNLGTDHLILGIRVTLEDESCHTFGTSRYNWLGTQLVENDPKGRPSDLPIDLHSIEVYS